MTDELQGTTDAQAAPRASIVDRTVCLAISIKKFGNRRKANIANVQTQAEKSLLALSKKLIDSAELKAVNGVLHDMNHFLDGVCTPSMFKKGVRMLAIPLIETVDAKLRDDFKPRFVAAVDAFLEVYPDQVREIETRLVDQFDAANYPTVEQMRALFSIEWRYVTFGVPGTLKAIKQSLFEEEKAKYAIWLQDAQAEYRNTTRARLFEFFTSLADALTPTSDGKKRRLYESTVEQLNQALSLFELQNATDDDEMKTVVEQGRAIMQGVDIKTLRDDDALRTQTEAKLREALANMQTMVVDRGTRSIEFEDTEGAA